MKIDEAIKQLDGGEDKPTFKVEIDGDTHTIDKQKFVVWMLKNEIIKALKNRPGLPLYWSLVSYRGIPLCEFSKEEIIHILGFVHEANFTLEYPDKQEIENGM